VEIFVDCKAAIAMANSGNGKSPKLARKLHDLLLQARGFMEVVISWVPSHGKVNEKYRGHALLPEYVVRAWNDRADRAAKRAQLARALGSERKMWIERCRAAKVWETKAVAALAATTEQYLTYARSLGGNA
jgi:hypothetical protein